MRTTAISVPLALDEQAEKDPRGLVQPSLLIRRISLIASPDNGTPRCAAFSGNSRCRKACSTGCSL
jgi:hypothetical protein